MSNWKDITWFEDTNLQSGTAVLNTGILGGQSNPWGEYSGNSNPGNGGSGSAPVIRIGTDLCIRDEHGKAITTESGELLNVNGV